MSFAFLPRILRTASFGLAVLYTLLLASSALVLGLIVYWSVQSSLNRQMTTSIDAEFDLLQQELRSEGVHELLTEIQERTKYFHALEYLVVDTDGRRLIGNLPEGPIGEGWTIVAMAPDPALGRDGRKFLVRSVVLKNGIRLSIGDDLGPSEEIKDAFLEALGWAVAAFIALGISGGLLLSRGFLQRVDAISQTAEAIMGGRLQSRIPLRGTNDNFDRLSSTLNQMLDRIQVLMESLGQVSNDIAHALRTPLGRLRQRLEIASASAEPNSACQSAIDAAVAETGKILDTFSALLRIAQMEAATRSAGFGEVDLSSLFNSVAEAYTAVAEDQGKTVTATIAPALRTWGDRDLIGEMLANLLDNAITHTPSGAQIRISLANGGSEIVASIEDNGLGVPATERKQIFRRFYRLQRSMKSPGNGLGLSLVAAVADLHNVELIAADNAPGLRITMIFPQSAPPRVERIPW